MTAPSAAQPAHRVTQVLGLVGLLGCLMSCALARTTAHKHCPGFPGAVAKVHTFCCERKPLRFGVFLCSSCPTFLAAEGSAQRVERRTQPLRRMSRCCRLSPLCLTVRALSTPKNTPDPVNVELPQLFTANSTYAQISPFPGLE